MPEFEPSSCYAPLAPPKECLQLVRCYTIPVTLGATEIRNDLEQILDGDCDFLWRGISLNTSSLNELRLRFQAESYYLSNARIRADLIRNVIKAHTPQLRLPRGGRIGLEAENTSGAAITADVVIVGVKDFRAGR